MKAEFTKQKMLQLAWIVAGSILVAVGMNIIIVPMGLYSGGFMGFAQLIRTFLVDGLHLTFLGRFDVAGIIYFLINIPLLLWALRELGKGFFTKTIATIIIQVTMLTVIPIPTTPLITDILTASIIGGLLCGAGGGLVLRGGSSGGGGDIIGMICTKKYANFSVGKIGIIINSVLFVIYMMMFDLNKVVYCIIFATICSVACDRIHVQNISTSAMIITKKADVSDAVIEGLRRGVTTWEGEGGYTGKKTYIFFVMLSKYEMNELKHIVHGVDPGAFVVFNEVSSITGNFEKRL